MGMLLKRHRRKQTKLEDITPKKASETNGKKNTSTKQQKGKTSRTSKSNS